MVVNRESWMEELNEEIRSWNEYLSECKSAESRENVERIVNELKSFLERIERNEELSFEELSRLVHLCE